MIDSFAHRYRVKINTIKARIEGILKIYHKIADKFPTDTQDWVNILFHNMAAKTIYILAETTKDRTGKVWSPVWITDHDGVDRFILISFQLNTPRSKDPIKYALGLPWNSGQALLERASFIKWDGYGRPQDKSRNVNI